MKRLVLVRHAKAVQWGYEDDFNRDLTERGRNDAARVSKHLKSIGITPDLIISSPANRAWQTAEIFIDELAVPGNKVSRDSELYPGMTTGELIEFLRILPGDAHTVFLFGHNPSFEFYAHGLCPTFAHEMPTSSAVVIDFKVSSWVDITSRSGSLFTLVNPKSLTT